jgi:5-hydroxyisourate hydrolase
MITTHILDTALGKPAAGVPVVLELRAGGAWQAVGRGETDADGRLRTLAPASIAAGIYRMSFDTAAYFARIGTAGFYPEVSVVFEVREAGAHFHVPLLLSPFGYSTYRGS